MLGRNTRNSASIAASEALGQADVFLDFQERLSRVAPINRPVLLIGERGTGKELAAARLHYLSGRWQKPFLTLNCSSLAASLIESELFGYERGAFTGAFQRRVGRFEAADGGTLFLDEIGNVPAEVQEKILRVVEYNAFERVGGGERVEVDVRIVAATHADLRELAAQQKFRPDLLDRMSFEVLTLPPLRFRGGDILLLARHFASRMALELGRADIPEFSAGVTAQLEGYAWPGNVRELKNVVERAVYRSDSALISEIEFDPFESPYARKPTAQPDGGKAASDARAPSAQKKVDTEGLIALPLRQAVWELKVRMIEEALIRSRYNQRRAAALLGLTYDQFRGLYRRYKTVHPDS
jgi:psp operon transcriptional activator